MGLLVRLEYYYCVEYGDTGFAYNVFRLYSQRFIDQLGLEGTLNIV